MRTFCMNPHGVVVNENTNGIVTVNGHSYEDKAKHTENTNFALLVKHFSEPFKDSNGYGESIARLSNMLGGGVIVQRFGDLVRGRRSTVRRIGELRHAHAGRDARRPQPRHSQAHTRRHYRDDTCP